MAKDYFQDILPPSDDSTIRSSATGHDDPIADTGAEQGRSIRDIQPPVRRPAARVTTIPPRPSSRTNESFENGEPIHKVSMVRHLTSWWIWVLAAVAILTISVLLIFAYRPTTITLTPKSRTVTLNETASFTAFPTSESFDGLTYTTHAFDIEDSEVIAAQGTRHVESKASGSVTVYNEYSATSVKLIKNTRFETPDGLIFRTPADVVIPGKSGSTPGQIRITVIADSAGEKYNVGPISRFTLPGLKSGDMYSKVYAKSTIPMSGGIIGEEPATAPGVLTSAISAVRGRLAEKAREMALAQSGDSGTTFFPQLAQVTYQSLPSTTEAGSSVRIHERAHVEMPAMPTDQFAHAIARASGEDVAPGSIRMLPLDGFTARIATSSAIAFGSDAIPFSLVGEVRLIWNIDTAALSAAIAGRESAAFQTVVDGFSGIQEARARIMPPWSKSFPSNALDIQIVLAEVSE